MRTLQALIATALVVGVCGGAVARLPPLDEKAQAAAEAKKAQGAADAAAAAAAQARAEDRVAARYIAEQRAKGKIINPQLGHTAPAAPPAAKAAKRAPARK